MTFKVLETFPLEFGSEEKQEWWPLSPNWSPEAPAEGLGCPRGRVEPCASLQKPCVQPPASPLALQEAEQLWRPGQASWGEASPGLSMLAEQRRQASMASTLWGEPPGGTALQHLTCAEAQRTGVMSHPTGSPCLFPSQAALLGLPAGCWAAVSGCWAPSEISPWLPPWEASLGLTLNS